MDQLMQGKGGKKTQPLLTLVLRAGSAIVMLGVGLASLSASLLEEKK